MPILFNVQSQNWHTAWDWSCRLKFRVNRETIPHEGKRPPEPGSPQLNTQLTVSVNLSSGWAFMQEAEK